MLKSGISKKHSQIHCRCFIMKSFTRLQSELMHTWPPKTRSIFNLVVFNLIWCFLTCSRLKFTSSWNTKVMIFNINILKVTSWTTFSHHRCWREFSRSPLLMFVPIAPIICLTLVRLTECSSHQYSEHQLCCLGSGCHQPVSSILPEKLFGLQKILTRRICVFCSRPRFSGRLVKVCHPNLFVCMIQL